MAGVLTLLLLQGLLGAFDTLWYHERVAALPLKTPWTAPELRLHAARDLVYGLVFLTLPFFVWSGWLAWVLVLLLACEIGITLADFRIEDRIRAPFGGVAPGERVTHALMAIVYGAFLARILPVLVEAAARPAGLERHGAVPPAMQWLMAALGIGVLLSGLRDLGAASGRTSFPVPFLSPRAAGPGPVVPVDQRRTSRS